MSCSEKHSLLCHVESRQICPTLIITVRSRLTDSEVVVWIIKHQGGQFSISCGPMKRLTALRFADQSVNNASSSLQHVAGQLSLLPLVAEREMYPRHGCPPSMTAPFPWPRPVCGTLCRLKSPPCCRSQHSRHYCLNVVSLTVPDESDILFTFIRSTSKSRP